MARAQPQPPRKRRFRGRQLKARKGRIDVRSSTWALVRRLVPPDVIQMMRIRDAWPKVARGRLFDHTWPARVDTNTKTLIVDVHDNQWLHEMLYLRQALTLQLKKVCPAADIEQIQPRLAPRRARTPVNDEPEPDPPPVLEGRALLPEVPDHDTLAVLESVHDHSLKHLLARVRVMLGRSPERNRRRGGPSKSES